MPSLCLHPRIGDDAGGPDAGSDRPADLGPAALAASVLAGQTAPPAWAGPAWLEALPLPAAVGHDFRCTRVSTNRALRDLLKIPDRPASDDEARRGRELYDGPLCRAALGERVDAEPLHVRTPDGRELRLLVSAVPVSPDGRPRGRNGKNKAGGAVAFYVDQTREAAVADELARSRDELRRALDEARAAAGTKDRFLAMISHELRTPLTPALVTLTNLQRDLEGQPGTERIRRELEIVRQGIELEARIVDDLLDLTKLARGKLKISARPVDLAAIVREVADLARPDVERSGLVLSVEVDAGRSRVVGDPARLRQVLWNLLTNATKFNRKGGRIDVRCFNPSPDLIRVDVADTGVGIDPEEIPSLFLAFEQMEHRTINRYGGLGLGLTISKGLLHLQGGRMHVRSEGVGWGAVFGLEFPLADESAVAVEPAKPEAEQRFRGTVGSSRPVDVPREVAFAQRVSADVAEPDRDAGGPGPLEILLVDDHAETLRAMTRLLGRLGHRVTAAEDLSGAESAIDRRRGRGEGRDGPFDLLVSDIGLPDGSGLDVPPMLEQAWPDDDVPSIALSGYGMARDLEASRLAGFAVHLVKPVSLEQLQQTIARVMDRARRA